MGEEAKQKILDLPEVRSSNETQMVEARIER